MSMQGPSISLLDLLLAFDPAFAFAPSLLLFAVAATARPSALRPPPSPLDQRQQCDGDGVRLCVLVCCVRCAALLACFGLARCCASCCPPRVRVRRSVCCLLLVVVARCVSTGCLLTDRLAAERRRCRGSTKDVSQQQKQQRKGGNNETCKRSNHAGQLRSMVVEP